MLPGPLRPSNVNAQAVNDRRVSSSSKRYIRILTILLPAFSILSSRAAAPASSLFRPALRSRQESQVKLSRLETRAATSALGSTIQTLRQQQYNRRLHQPAIVNADDSSLLQAWRAIMESPRASPLETHQHPQDHSLAVLAQHRVLAVSSAAAHQPTTQVTHLLHPLPQARAVTPAWPLRTASCSAPRTPQAQAAPSTSARQHQRSTAAVAHLKARSPVAYLVVA